MSQEYVCNGCGNRAVEGVARSWEHLQLGLPMRLVTLGSLPPTQRPEYDFCTRECLAAWAVKRLGKKVAIRVEEITQPPDAPQLIARGIPVLEDFRVGKVATEGGS